MQSDEVIAQAYRTVNVRSGPSTEYDIIGQLNSGNEARITGRSDEESNWLRIEFEAQEGWVAYFTVTVVGDANTLPVVEPLADRSDAPVLRTSDSDGRASFTEISSFRHSGELTCEVVPAWNTSGSGTLEPGSSADVTGRTDR